MLQVKDAETLDHFITNARQAWIKANPGKSPKRGAPSLGTGIYRVLDAAVRDGALKDNHSQYRCVQVALEKLEHTAHVQTVTKYVKRWKAIRAYCRPLAKQLHLHEQKYKVMAAQIEALEGLIAVNSQIIEQPDGSAGPIFVKFITHEQSRLRRQLSTLRETCVELEKHLHAIKKVDIYHDISLILPVDE